MVIQCRYKFINKFIWKLYDFFSTTLLLSIKQVLEFIAEGNPYAIMDMNELRLYTSDKDGPRIERYIYDDSK